MIQRIQSVYLLLTTILSVLFLNGTVLSFINKTGSLIRITLSGIVKSTEGHSSVSIEKALPLSILLLLLPLISLVTIFLFKNRILQLLFAKILIGLDLLMIICAGYYSYIITSEYGAAIEPGIKMILPVLLLIFSILAHRGIRKDELLVKSYDRLR